MDYKQAIHDVKLKYNCEDSPVVTFGGSYGAMLAAWMRMKFPQIVQAEVVSGGAIEEFHGYEKAPNYIFFSWLNVIYKQMGGLDEK